MINKATLDLIKKHEGLRLTAYKCPAGVNTIGYGSTFYIDGSKVKTGDIITQVEAEYILNHVINSFALQVNALLEQPLTENQFGALVSFAYNVGVNAFSKSTLLKKVNIDPLDDSICLEFSRWNKSGGKILKGLVNRRKDEADLYFTV